VQITRKQGCALHDRHVIEEILWEMQECTLKLRWIQGSRGSSDHMHIPIADNDCVRLSCFFFFLVLAGLRCLYPTFIASCHCIAQTPLFINYLAYGDIYVCGMVDTAAWKSSMAFSATVNPLCPSICPLLTSFLHTPPPLLPMSARSWHVCTHTKPLH
jgi:hypothetical protein